MKQRILADVRWLVGILAVGLALRLVNIGTEPYWGDEVLSLDVVRHFSTAGEMLRYLAQVEFHPPLYYLLLRPWVALFGTAETAVRSLSVLFGLGCVAMTYVAGIRLFRDRVAALSAAAVVAVLPMQVEYGQEARPYAIFCFFGIVATVAAWEWLKSRRAGWLFLYAAVSVVGLWLHYSYFFILGATSSWWFVSVLREKKGERFRAFSAFVFAHGAVFLGFYPWLGNLLYKMALTKVDIFGLPHHVLAYRAPDMVENTLHQIVWMTKAKYVSQIEIFGMLVAKVTAAVFVLQALMARKRDEAGAAGRGHAVAYVGWLLAVTLCLFMFSPQSVPYSRIYQRHVLFATVPVALLLGFLFSRLPKKRAAVLAAVFAASLIPFVANVAGDDALWDPDHRLKEAGEFISEQYRSGDLVLVSVSIVRTDLSHYLKPEIPVAEMLPIPYYGHDVWESRETLGLIENESQVRITKPTQKEIDDKLNRLTAVHQPKRIWLYGFAATDWAVYQWFTDRGYRHVYKSIGDIFQVHLFERK